MAPELSHRFLARLTQIDYAREMAFVAVGKESGELLGVVRFVADPDYVQGRVRHPGQVRPRQQS